MKKIIVSIFLFTSVAFTIFAQDMSELRKSSRRILYAVNPVEAIIAVPDIDTLLDYVTLAQLSRLPSRRNDPNILNETDSVLMEHLATMEWKRRELTADNFSLYLQETHEKINPLSRRNDTLANAYIKIDSWIDLFRLRLMFAN